MIEAVENHNPEVIVIDEIGRELEAQAARTIAERGVQLIGTAHGQTISNLLMNPTLSDLIGGIESVTLSIFIAPFSSLTAGSLTLVQAARTTSMLAKNKIFFMLLINCL